MKTSEKMTADKTTMWLAHLQCRCHFVHLYGGEVESCADTNVLCSIFSGQQQPHSKCIQVLLV